MMNPRRLRLCQVTVFILGWIAYASTYLLRKPIGVVGSTFCFMNMFSLFFLQKFFYDD